MRLAVRLTVLALVVLGGFTGTAFGTSPVLEELEDAFVALHESVRPFVVNIDTESRSIGQGMDPEQLNELFRFFGLPGPEGAPPARRVPRLAQGSGFIYDKEGHIITNNHLVEGAKTIKVKLWNDEELEAQVVGQDRDTDLAVIKIDVDFDLPVAPLGDSDGLKVGQFAIAVGSPRGFEGSFSFGHITALGRENLNLPRSLRFQNFIQTDAAINLGNSGGPLCNLNGEVIGISIAIVFGANSLGFAIPANTAKEIVPVLISEGKITRGFLGVKIRDADAFAEHLGLPDKKGACVVSVEPDTPAQRAKIQPADVIRKVNGEVVEDSGDLVVKISEQPPGAATMIEVWRNGEVVELEVNLDEFDSGLDAQRAEENAYGLHVQDLKPELLERLRLEPGVTGVIVTEVDPESAAEEARLTPGDVITKVGKREVSDTDGFYEALAGEATPGQSLLIVFIRRDGEQDITFIKVPQETPEE